MCFWHQLACCWQAKVNRLTWKCSSVVECMQHLCLWPLTYGWHCCLSLFIYSYCHISWFIVFVLGVFWCIVHMFWLYDVLYIAITYWPTWCIQLFTYWPNYDNESNLLPFIDTFYVTFGVRWTSWMPAFAFNPVALAFFTTNVCLYTSFYILCFC